MNSMGCKYLLVCALSINFMIFVIHSFFVLMLIDVLMFYVLAFRVYF